MSSLIQNIYLVVGRLIAYLHSRHPIAPEALYFFWSYPVWPSLDSHSDHSTLRSLISFFCFLKSFGYPLFRNNSAICLIILWVTAFVVMTEYKRTLNTSRSAPKGSMSIINILDKLFLIIMWIHTPRSSDNPHITLRDSVSCNLKRSQSVLNLKKWIKLIHFSALNGWLIGDITFWEILIAWTIDTLPRTSPELGQERDNGNTRK